VFRFCTKRYTQEKFNSRETGDEEEKEGLRKLRSKSYEGRNKKKRIRCFGMLWILWNKSYDGVYNLTYAAADIQLQLIETFLAILDLASE
jgi:hypothetical protein